MTTTAPLFTDAERKRLENLRLKPAKPHGVPIAGDWQSRRFGASGLFADHRDYAPGDDLRYVDWNVYARLGDLVVKRFEAEEAIELLVALDRSPSMEGAKSLAARRLAGALGYVTLAQLDRVRLAWLPATADGATALFPGRGSAGRWLDEVAEAPLGGRTDLAADLGRVLMGRRRRTLSVVLSDFHDARAGVDGIALLRARGQDVVVIHVVDAADVDLPLGHALLCEDAETGATRKVDVTEELLASVRAAWRRRARRLEAWCVGRGVRYLRVDAHTPVWDVLPRLLGVGWRRPGS